jgi:SAM-dependent methyltransferase
MEALRELVPLGVHIQGARILSPGCGTGSDALALVKQGGQVLAVDWSPAAIREIRERYNQISLLKGTLEVQSGDFFEMDPRPVDLVVEHTFFCAIDPTARPRYVERASSWLISGGYLVGNFFVLSDEQALSLPALSLAPSGEGPPFATTVAELRHLLASQFEEVLLRPASTSEPERRPGMEWVGVFKRR